jgi:FlaA1/EpsC-like NDP-sugar epimerase
MEKPNDIRSRVMLNKKTILITSGTGSFGKKFIQIVLANYKPEKLIISAGMKFTTIYIDCMI